MAFVFRGPTDNDIPFISNSWLESMRDYGFFSKGVPNTTYYHYQKNLIKSLCSTGSVLIMHLDTEPDIIIGWACFEVFENAIVLHYVYTKRNIHRPDGSKQSLRRKGVAKALVEYIKAMEGKDNIVYTHLTKQVYAFKKKLTAAGWLYNPYVMFASLPKGWDVGS